MKVAAITDVGRKRQVNQDYIFCSEDSIGSFSNLFIVADGMGGHKAGDYASRVCVETIVDSIRKSSLQTPIGVLEEAIKSANLRIFSDAAGNSELEGMGTTLVAAVVAVNHILYVANIGDSRLYIVNGEEIRQITEDHSLVEAMVKNGEIKRSEARFHPNKNIITRAVGTSMKVAADYFEVQLKPEDKILICSDGLSNMMADEEIRYIINSHPQEVEAAAQELVGKANENGGKDNISIILIKV